MIKQYIQWHPIRELPKETGIYYVLRKHFARVDYSVGECYWYYDIETTEFTIQGGWNTFIDFDGTLHDKSAMDGHDIIAWSPVMVTGGN